MTHAAPTPHGRDSRTAVPAGQDRLPDVLDARIHRIAGLAMPVVLGLVYGYWAAANRRSGGEITGWNLLFGFVTGITFMILYVAVRALAPHLPREVHALAWAAFAGGTFGFLYSQSEDSVLRSSVMGLTIGAVTFVVMFYRYYTHEDAAGHRTD